MSVLQHTENVTFKKTSFIGCLAGSVSRVCDLILCGEFKPLVGAKLTLKQ